MGKYIDRDVAIAKLTALEVLTPVANLVDARRLIADMPDADVIPAERGKWEWDTADIYRCSVCGRKAHIEEVMFRPAWSFCPNCGAKVEGNDND